MAIEVTKYYARWDPYNQKGFIIIKWDGGSKAFDESCFTNLTSFQIMIDLLRNEKPVWWDEQTNRLFANDEPVGEGELS